MAQLTFSDLFAGIGGMRLGFTQAGAVCVFSCEWDKFAQLTYQTNFGEIPAGDITTIPTSAIPDHDILVAGFPCQPFSIAGVSKHNALGIDHGFAHPTQGNLFFEVARIIKAKQPKAFLLENVKNLQSHDKGRTFQIIKQTLSNLGYYIYYQVNEINNPQQRGMLKFFDRAFIAKDLGLQVESFIYPLSNLIPFVIEQLSSGS